MYVSSRWNIGHLKKYTYPTISCFLCFIPFFDAISTTIAYHSLMVFYLQKEIHENITQRFNSYATIHGKEQHVRQNVICKIKYLEWLINMISFLYFKPYAKYISLSVRFVSHVVLLPTTRNTQKDCRTIQYFVQEIYTCLSF